jgi:tetratricopeptide (TPR) repeat protein
MRTPVSRVARIALALVVATGVSAAAELPPGIARLTAERVERFLDDQRASEAHDPNLLAEAGARWDEVLGLAAKGLVAPELTARSAREIIPATLRELHAGYERASASLEEGRAATAAESFDELVRDETSDAWLVAYARLGLGEALADLGRTREAELVLSHAIEEGGDRLAHLAEALLERARCLEELGLDEAARECHERIVALDPAEVPGAIMALARERVARAAAEQEPGIMTPIIELMDRSEGRLDEADTGHTTQGVQREIIEKLDELIEMAEKAEQSSAGSASASQSSSPASSASLPGGEGGDPKNLRRVSEGEDEDAWGRLPEREREAVLQTLRERFPARYRELLEQYYRSIQEGE